MPLLSGKQNVGRNVTQLKSDGYSNPKQRVAIALSVARRGKADGGSIDDTPIIDSYTGAVQPSDAAQQKFNRVADSLVSGAKNYIEFPGNAMRNGMTTEDAVNWAAPTAMGMVAGARLPGGTPEGALGSSGAKLVQPEGIRAYHGSPYDFDRFDASKIGTGEGAQAYGHGLYFAENEGVARQYRDQLSGKSPPLPSIDSPDFQQALRENLAASEIQVAGGLENAKTSLNKKISGYAPGRARDDYEAALEMLYTNPTKFNGRMYEVNINAHPDKFLDWDKPLNAQPKELQDFVSAGPTRLGDNDIVRGQLTSPDGQSIYRRLQTQMGSERPMAGSSVPHSNEPAATAALREAGIPGIRYLDQGSRNKFQTDAARARGEQFTHNYVVFDPKIIDILRKYGLAGGAAGLGSATSKDNGMKHGGAIRTAKGMAAGGVAPIPFYARNEARNLEHAGMVHSPTGGRSDMVPANVRNGAYVLPADTLSAVGGGNSANGAMAFNKMFKMGPYGSSIPHPAGGGMRMPTLGMMKGNRGFADGGMADSGDDSSVPVVVSGGEFVIPPDKVAEIGGGDLTHGHNILDGMVKHIRRKAIKKLKSLPSPEKN